MRMVFLMTKFECNNVIVVCNSCDTFTVTASVHPIGVDESGLNEFGAISTGFKLCIGHPLMKNSHASPVWKYFKHFDPIFHPDLKNHCCCLIC